MTTYIDWLSIHYQWFFSGIGVYLIGGLFSSFLILWYFIPSRNCRPRIRISHEKSMQSTCSSDQKGKVKFKFQGKFIFYNEADESANSIEILWPNDWLKKSFQKLKENHLKGFERKEITYEISFDWPIEDVGGHEDRFTKQFPENLKNAELIVSYKNSKNSNYYTQYWAEDFKETNIFCYFKPKFRKKWV